MKKWLKNWGYLLLMLLVGVLYFSYVDEWKVYAKALSPVAEWYGEQSVKYEVLAKVNDWLTGVFGQEDVHLPDEGETTDDMLIAGDITGEDAGSEKPAPEGDLGEGSESDEDDKQNVTQNQDAVDADNPGQPGGNVGIGGITGGTHIDLGGPESGMEVEFGEAGVEEQLKPDWQIVDDMYFADAVFIGDSRTVGMFEYGDLEEITTFYAGRGLSVYDVFDKKIVEVPGQKKKITVEEALQENTFSKIYLMLGLNEMGTGTTETFLVKYKEVLDHLRELQPDAIIYVQAIMKLTTERSGKGDQFHNPGIEERNAGLAEFADNKKVFFLDVNPLICDETGGMIEEYTYDGIHLKAKYIGIWKEYLKEHAIAP